MAAKMFLAKRRNYVPKDLVSRLDHAAYLGRDLEKAEIAPKRERLDPRQTTI